MTPAKKPAAPPPVSIGRVVIFREPAAMSGGETSRDVAAIVTAVLPPISENDGQPVSLTVFPPSRLPYFMPVALRAELEEPADEGEPAVIPESSWRWPERV